MAEIPEHANADPHLDEKIEAARRKVLQANENACEDNKLYNRTKFALDYCYNQPDMAHIIKALNDLGEVSHDC